MTASDTGSKGAPLALLIARSDRAALAILVNERLRDFENREVLQVLRHPFVSLPVVEEVLASRRFLSVRSVRKALALLPVTPRADALACLEDLTWRDLLDVGREPRCPAPVRRAANLKILDALPRLSAGEKISLARFADRDLLAALLREGDTAILSAVLRNPRLVPDDLVAWVSAGRPSGRALAFLANDPVWRTRRDVRLAILSNQTTPRASALALLGIASRAELRSLAVDPRADGFLRAEARERLETSTGARSSG